MSLPPGDRQPGVYPAYPGSAEPSRLARPPLTKRMRPVHWIAIDCVVGGFLALVDAASVGRNLHDGQAGWPLVVLFMVVVFVPVAFRRRAPVTAFGALLILGVLLSKL